MSRLRLVSVVFAGAAFGLAIASLYRSPQFSLRKGSYSHHVQLLAHCPALLKSERSGQLEQIVDSAEEAAIKHRLDPELIYAVMMVESRCTPHARSRVGAQGLMQLTPATAHWLGVTNPWEIRANIHGGAKYLAYLMRRFNGDARLALAAYNAGPSRIARNPNWSCKETRHYVSRVLTRYQELLDAKANADTNDDIASLSRV